MKRAKMRFGYWFVKSTVMVLFKMIFSLKVKGLEKVPLTGRLIIVANHVSNYDPPLVGSLIPREIHIAAKIQLFKGLLGKLIAYLNSIPVKRSGSDTEAIKTMTRLLKSEQALLIFPEGTRTIDPNGVTPKAGVGMLAKLGKSDLLPIKVEGTSNLKEAFFRKTQMSVTVGEVISLDTLLRDVVDKKEAYQHIADTLMDKIRNMHYSE